MSEEKNLLENIKDSRVFIQYFVLIWVMAAINMILNKSYGNVNDTFFCADISGSFFNSKRLLWIFSALIYAVIVGVREWTKKVEYTGTTVEERKEEFKDFMLYIVICLTTFVFAGAYIRRKFNTGGQKGGSDGAFQGTVSAISSTGFGTLALYTGILIILINVISNSYQYLKNKKQNVKDKFLRAIYFSQIATMFIFLISSFFIAGFGCSSFSSSSGGNIVIAVIKWVIVIGGSILGVHMINRGTDGENWFGDPKGVEAPPDNNEEDISGEVDVSD